LPAGIDDAPQNSPNDFDADDFRRVIPRFSEENFPRIRALADGLATIGKEHGATGAQVALGWVLAQGDDVIPIPGSRRVKVCTPRISMGHGAHADVSQNLDENLAALKVKLSPEQVAAVRQLADDTDIGSGGERYPAMMRELGLYVDTPELES
jgi:aryl-alcohol dehydrogenase-like predicted oxidoreductase